MECGHRAKYGMHMHVCCSIEGVAPVVHDYGIASLAHLGRPFASREPVNSNVVFGDRLGRKFKSRAAVTCSPSHWPK